MIKLITPPGMLLTTALLVIYVAYAYLIGTIEHSWPLKIAGATAMVAAYGAAMIRPWSRYLVYALTVGFFAKLGGSIYAGFRAGFFGFQYGTPSAIARSLTPSLIMALLSAACCVLVYRQFRGPKHPGPSPL